MRSIPFFVALVLVGCRGLASGSPSDIDVGTPDSTLVDASSADSALVDGSSADSAVVVDADFDASVDDASIEDTSVGLDSTVDATSDAAPDAAVSMDSGTVVDAGGSDASLPSNPCNGASATGLELTANVNSIGVVLERAGLSVNGMRLEVMGPDGMWRQGHSPALVRSGLVGTSLFGLQADTPYAVRLGSGTSFSCALTRTLPDQASSAVSREVYVRTGPSGNGSQSSPYGTIQAAVDAAQAGDRIHVAAGTYHESVRVSRSGSAGRSIQIVGDAGAILQGSMQPSNWTMDSANIWRSTGRTATNYVGRNGERFYLYSTLSGLRSGIGDDDVPYAEGWFQQGTTLYVRCSQNPSTYEWQVADLTSAFVITGDHVVVEGFRIQFYGAGERPLIDIAGAENSVVRNNVLVGGSNGIWVHDEGGSRANFIRIEGNDISDPPIDQWAWGEEGWNSVKGTNMETSAVVLEGSRGAIVRDNHIHHYFNGVYTGRWDESFTDETLARDVDVYDNRFERIADDVFEPEGTSINNRFHHNVVREMLCGASIAPVSLGPTFVMFNVFHDVQGTPIKWDINTSGYAFIYHNSAQTFVTEHAAVEYYQVPADRGIYRNNIFVGTRRLLRNPYGGNENDIDYNNWFTAEASPEFVWGNRTYTRAAFCSSLGFECHGWVENPRMVDARNGNYALQAGSPNIDRALRIPGINDSFSGAGPDVGAIEYGR